MCHSVLRLLWWGMGSDVIADLRPTQCYAIFRVFFSSQDIGCLLKYSRKEIIICNICTEHHVRPYLCMQQLSKDKICNWKQITRMELDSYWSHKPVVHFRIFSLCTVTHFYEFLWENWLYMFQICICQLSNQSDLSQTSIYTIASRIW